MFRRIVSKLNNKQFAFFTIPKRRFTEVLKPKRSNMLPFIAMTTTGTLALCYSHFRFDNFQTILKKASHIGTLEEAKETIEYLKRHLEHYKKIKGENSREVAYILWLLSLCFLGVSEDKLEGIRYGEESIEMFLQLGLKHRVVSHLDQLTEVVRGRCPKEASRLAQKSREYKRKYGCDAILQNLVLADFYLQKNDVEGANQCIKDAKSLLDSLDPSTERLGEAYSFACDSFSKNQRFEDSNRYCQKKIHNIENLRKKKGEKGLTQEDRESEFQALAILASNTLKLDHIQDSLEFFEKADESLETWPNKSEDYYSHKVDIPKSLGMFFISQGDYGKALIYLKLAHDTIQRAPQNVDRVELTYLLNLLRIGAYLMNNEPKKASDCYKETLEFVKSKYGENDPHVKEVEEVAERPAYREAMKNLKIK